MSADQPIPLPQRRPKLLWPVGGVGDLSKRKARQRSKIAEIQVALVKAGLVTLNEQATTLGLSRSTAWSILKPNHKSSGLEAHTIVRILRSPRLPGRVRQGILEYIREKIQGPMVILSDGGANLPDVSWPRCGTNQVERARQFWQQDRRAEGADPRLRYASRYSCCSRNTFKR